MLVYLRKRSS